MDLRIYTRELPTKEAATEPERILTRLRAVLFELRRRDPQGWQDAAAPACAAVLAEEGTSEDALGLRAWVQMRAAKYLGQQTKVASPAGSLRDILRIHKRLSQARAASWEALRSEWVQLLRLRKGIAEDQAAWHIDATRCRVLRGRLVSAVQRVRRALAQRRGSTSSKRAARCEGNGAPE